MNREHAGSQGRGVNTEYGSRRSRGQQLYELWRKNLYFVSPGVIRAFSEWAELPEDMKDVWTRTAHQVDTIV